MSSKTLEKAGQVTRKVTTALTEHVAPACVAIDAELSGRGAEPLGLGAALGPLGAAVSATFDAYAAAEDRVTTETGEDTVARDGRDDHRDALKSTLSTLAQSVALNYGAHAPERLGLDGPTPVTPDRLLTMATRFLALTERGIPDLGKPAQPWNVPDVAAARAAAVTQTAALQADLRAVDQDTRETQQARTDRDQAGQTWHNDLRLAADLARTILRRAGRADLATKVLPTAREIDQLETAPAAPTQDPTDPGDTPS